MQIDAIRLSKNVGRIIRTRTFENHCNPSMADPSRLEAGNFPDVDTRCCLKAAVQAKQRQITARWNRNTMMIWKSMVCQLANTVRYLQNITMFKLIYFLKITCFFQNDWLYYTVQRYLIISGIGDVMKNWKKTAGLSVEKCLIAIVTNWTNVQHK